MKSLALRCNRWRYAVLAGWIVVLVGLGVAALAAGTAFTESTNLPDSGSTTAYSVLARARSAAQSASAAATVTGNVAWHTKGVAVDSPTVQKEAQAMLAEVAALPGVEAVVSPYDAAGARQINPSAGTAYASVVLSKGANVATVTGVAQHLASSTVDVEVGGQAFTVQPGGGATEGLGILAALVILLLVFRSLWAALLPIITGVTGVAASLLLVMLARDGPGVIEPDDGCPHRSGRRHRLRPVHRQPSPQGFSGRVPSHGGDRPGA